MHRTDLVLGDHFDKFISTQLQDGRYGSASEVMRQALRLLEEHEQKVSVLRQALIEGENSGKSTRLDMKKIIRAAKREAGLDVRSIQNAPCRSRFERYLALQFQELG